MKTTKKKKVVVIPRKYVVAVDNGVKWLDLTFGRKEWLKRMDMTNFNIEHGNTCIAGNVFKDVFFKNINDIYFNGKNDYDGYELFCKLMESLGIDSNGIKFGFFSENPRGYQYLQDLWVRKIKRLKLAQNKKK